MSDRSYNERLFIHWMNALPPDADGKSLVELYRDARTFCHVVRVRVGDNQIIELKFEEFEDTLIPKILLLLP